MSVISTYEKMMKEGKLNQPIRLSQPTPQNEGGKTMEPSPFKHVNNESSSSKSSVKKQLIEQKVKKLEQRITLLENSLITIMKAHKALMEK